MGKLSQPSSTTSYRETRSSALSGVRFYVSGRNLATLTGYKGLDPEVDTSGLTPGIDNRDTYPTIRTFTFGATFTF